jgi:nucleotide-binding universal stress UspA family protein
MYSKILVPLDGSQTGECTLGHVKAIAAGCGVSELVLLMVTESAWSTGMHWAVNRDQAFNMLEEERKNSEMISKKANEYLTKVSEELKKAGLAVKTVVIEEEANQHPADVILDYSEKNKVDLIVIATHGRSGVTRWAFGSVAERVVRHALVPVLTVTPSGCRI